MADQHLIFIDRNHDIVDINKYKNGGAKSKLAKKAWKPEVNSKFFVQ